MVCSITVNLLLLFYFKYSYFFVDIYGDVLGIEVEYFNHFNAAVNSITGGSAGLTVDKLLPPVGISFFTFQTISYSVDVYKGKIKPVNSILDFGFYVSFFPQLVAGPIVRASEFIPQLYQPYRLSREDFGGATWMILKGMVKKLIIGDYIAVNFVDRVFENPVGFTGFENMLSVYGYSLQVYVDFSGYTDIAIGIALLMGFRLPINFNSPYKARSVAEFWRRWHISLSTWLKDYLYIPLGGSRKASLLTWVFYVSLPFIIWAYFGFDAWPYIAGGTVVVYGALIAGVLLNKKVKKEVTTSSNLMITMVLGGFWHGNTWLFVIWGALNGTGLVVYKLWRKISPWDGRNDLVWRFWSIFLTFNFITFTRLYFRGESLEKVDQWYAQVWGNFGWDLIPMILDNYKWPFLMIYVGLILHWFPSKDKEIMRRVYIDSHFAIKVVVACVTIFAIYQAMSSDLQAFIYFQF